jgi:ribosomal protein S18 acetylase RimI-like enzyme
MGTITYKRFNSTEIDLIKELWEGLRAHHKEKTEHFKERFENLTFETRKQVLLEKEKKGRLMIDIAMINAGRIIAYCVSSIDENKEGEIDSIFVDEQYRKNKIGDELMNRALAWFDDNDVSKRKIVVAQGNEETFRFYAKFGFYHLFSTLHQKT